MEEMWDSFRRIEEPLCCLPAGRAMFTRIRAALTADPAMPPETRALWGRIGFAVIDCAGFPLPEFNALFAQGDFDVRWPLTFACWYVGQSGASVDRLCAAFLKQKGLCEAAQELLSEYGNNQWVSAWGKQLPCP